MHGRGGAKPFGTPDGPKRARGRPPGSPNKMGRDLKTLVMQAAENVGFVAKDPQTGEWVATGKGGILKYLEWAAVHKAECFIPLMARVAPKQVFAAALTSAEVEAELRDCGLPVQLLDSLPALPDELDDDEDPDPCGMMKPDRPRSA
jgi:hypothetical protein